MTRAAAVGASGLNTQSWPPPVGVEHLIQVRLLGVMVCGRTLASLHVPYYCSPGPTFSVNPAPSPPR